jgi:hypothetical protein
MRRRFNRGRYHERVLSGELTAIIRRNTTPSRTEANEPPGTVTQEISYLDKAGMEIARVHQYVRVGGMIGASGKPDPKRLLENGILYRLRKPPSNFKDRCIFWLLDFRDRIVWYFGGEVD